MQQNPDCQQCTDKAISILKDSHSPYALSSAMGMQLIYGYARVLHNEHKLEDFGKF